MSLIGIWTISATFVTAFECELPNPWSITSSDKCINLLAFWTYYGVFNIVTDIVLIVLPVSIVIRLQMKASQKAVIIACDASRSTYVPLSSPGSHHSHPSNRPLTSPFQRHNSPNPTNRLPTDQHPPNCKHRPTLRSLGPDPPRADRALFLPAKLLLPIPQIPYRRTRNRHDPRRRSEHHQRPAPPPQRQPLRRRLLESQGIAIPAGPFQLQQRGKKNGAVSGPVEWSKDRHKQGYAAGYRDGSDRSGDSLAAEPTL